MVKSLKSPQKSINLLVSQRQVGVGVEPGPEQVERAGSQEVLPPSLITAPVMETTVTEMCSHLPLSSSSFQSAAVNQPPPGGAVINDGL